MGFRAACRPVSLSNYIAFDVFFFSGFMLMPSFYAHLYDLRQFARASKELKKSLDVLGPRLERRSSEK